MSNGPQPRDDSELGRARPFDDAKKGIEACGLKVKEVDGYSDTIAVGSVISTSPGAGARRRTGATVTVTVCRGPATVTVPDVVGKNVEQGINELKAAGFTIGQVAGPRKKQQILFQDPAATRRRPAAPRSICT